MKKNKQLNRENALTVTKVYLIGVMVVFAIFMIRFSQLMLFKTANGQNLELLVQQLYNRNEVATASRGNIYDVSGTLIATDVKTYSVYAVLSERYKGISAVDDKLYTAKTLSKHLKLSEDDILKLLNQSNLYQTSFGTAGAGLTHEQKTALEQEKLPGIYFTEKITRDYPKGYFANNIIGLAQDSREDTTVETRENPLKGTMGLELQYNVQLSGIDGLVSYERDFYGLKIQGTQKVIEVAKDGNNIYTTLDSHLNDYLEQLVSQAYMTYQPEKINVMVTRPKTGDVVAAAQRPTFNAKLQNYPENGWVNQLVEESYEPGSTLKVFVLAAAVNEGIFSPMDLYRSGNIKVGNITIQDWNVDGWGTITYLDGLARSSNVAFINLVAQIGYDKWKSYLDAFGFGKSTKSGFANESYGANVYSTDEVRATTSFGQGISVTNLQMVQAFGAIANGGKMQKLRFVDRIEKPDTKEVTYLPIETLGQPILSETAQKVLYYLEESVNRPHATMNLYKMKNVRLAMKTGTAQIFDQEKQKYLLGKNESYIHSIVAYVPSDNPEYVVYMTAKSKTSEPLGDVFKKFNAFALTYVNRYSSNIGNGQMFGKPLTDESESSTQVTASSTIQSMPSSTQFIQIPDAKNATVAQTKQAFNELGFKQLYFLGTGDAIEKQMPRDNEMYAVSEKLLFYTGGRIQMPNMIGWSRQEVARLAALFDKQIVAKGEGFVTKQSIAPNTLLTLDDFALEVMLSQPETTMTTTRETTTRETTTQSTKKESETTTR